MLSFADSPFEFPWLRSSQRFLLRSRCRRPICKCEPYCLCKKSPHLINQQVITFQSFWDLISPHRKNALKCIWLYFSKLKFHRMSRTFPVRLQRVLIPFRRNLARMVVILAYVLMCSLVWFQDFIFPCFNKRAQQLWFSFLRLRKILGKLNWHAPGEVNLQSKQDLICNVGRVKVPRSTYSMADVILLQRIYYSLRIDRQKKIYLTHNNKNNIRDTVRVSMFQKLLVNKHL